MPVISGRQKRKEALMEDDPNAPMPAAEDAPTHGRGREPITRERIAERAYQISQSDQAGTDQENWLRAEEELREEHEAQEG
jgi:hypothetical protein